jgi:hypothetical protein
MKKLLLSASMLLTAGFAFAQVSNSNLPVKESKSILIPRSTTAPVVVNSTKSTENSTKAKKAVVQDWYLPLNFLTQFQGGESQLKKVLTRSLSFVSADTLFKVVRADGEIDGPSMFSYGQVLDPKDDLIENTENPGIRLSNFNPYTLDSILFQYAYVRNVDSSDNDVDGNNEEVIDTVFVAYYANSNITKTNYTGGTMDKVSLVNWSVAKKISTTIFKIDTFLLGNDRSNSPFDTTSFNADQTTFGSKFAQLKAPNGMNITVGNLVGFAVTFKSGIPAVINGDTAVIINQGTGTFTRRANTFGTVLFANQSTSGVEYTNPRYYNSGIFQPSWNAYGQLSQSWSGRYIPGYGGIFASDLFLQTGFFLTSLNVGVAENDLVSISSVYPNPANGSTNVSFNLKQAGNVAVSITNLLGQTVATVNPGKMAAGSNNVSLNLSNIKAGVYFVNVTVDGVNTTKKLTVTE